MVSNRADSHKIDRKTLLKRTDSEEVGRRRGFLVKYGGRAKIVRVCETGITM